MAKRPQKRHGPKQEPKESGIQETRETRHFLSFLEQWARWRKRQRDLKPPDKPSSP